MKPLSKSTGSIHDHMQQTRLRFCEPCRKYKRNCNSQRPSCSNCLDLSEQCSYGYHNMHIIDQSITSSRSVFTTQNARRLSSGSACETCRRRKTKCDGGSPCHYCRANNIECVNHILERRQQALSKALISQQGKHRDNSVAIARSSLANICKSKLSTTAAVSVNESGDGLAAMDRIEDRLTRIERLMTTFKPKTTSAMDCGDKQQPVARRHRHSTLERHVAIAQERVTCTEPFDPVHNLSRLGPISPPATTTVSPVPQMSLSSLPDTTQQQQSVAPYRSDLLPSPPSSTSSTLDNDHYLPSQEDNKSRWVTGSIPSLMDQLSNRTFPTSAVDYTATQYPIYPLTTSPPPFNSQPSTIPTARQRSFSRLP